MPSARSVRAFPIAATCAILAACSDGTAPAVADVDELLAVMGTGQTFGAAGSTLGGGIAPFLAGPSAGKCQYDNGPQAFVCPTVTRDGLTMSMFFQLLDESNAPQSAFSPTTTAAIRTVSDISGTLQQPPGAPPLTLTISGHRDQTLTGLLTGTHTLNGTGTTSSTFDAGDGSVTITTKETTTDLVLPARGSGNQYPQSGSIAFETTSSDGFFNSSSTITFNGTSIATITWTFGGHTETCTIDMSGQGAAPVCS